MIQAESVSKRFATKQALESVSLTAPDGLVTGFVGPNGAGKTTLMKIIAGLLPADSGTTTVDGLAFHQCPRPARTLGVYLSPEWLPPRRTAAEHLRYVCHTQSLPTDRIRPALEAVGLWGAHERQIKTYSLGMRQRLGIAVALIAEPANLMLDEPVNGLDPNGVIWLRDLLREQAASGKTVLLSSHLMSELELVADRIVMLQQGTVVHSGTLAELGQAMDNPEVYIESSCLDEVVGVLHSRGLTTRTKGCGVLVCSPDPEHVGQIVFSSGLRLSHLSRTTGSLEDLFLSSLNPSIEEPQ